MPWLIDNGGYDHAVRTIDDVRAELHTRLGDAGASVPGGPEYVAVLDLSDASGGSITFPDGTVVTVEPVGYDELAARIDVEWVGRAAEVIDAYNSR